MLRVLGGEDFEWGRGKFVHGEQRLRWIGGGLGCFSKYYNITHFSPRLHALHVQTWYTQRNKSVKLQLE